jgi:ring-1,2-phenylacetyl-CoA epoxidase subunit PaaD
MKGNDYALDLASIYAILSEAPDPEIPVLNVLDLGIVRQVLLSPDNAIEVIITPTYSGCPAMDVIAVNIRAVLQAHGYEKVKITTVLDPAWTTDWITEEGRSKLLAYGIAPPMQSSVDKNALFFEEKHVPCPRCSSTHTEMISQFGSTACKALYKCLDCLEPFDYFKCH